MEKKIKPLFKYIGGKSWLSDQLNEKVQLVLNKNPSINSYCEPFCGGLGSFLSVQQTLYKNNIRTIHLSDINQTLIFIYQSIKKNHNSLIGEILELEEQFQKTIPENNNTHDKNEIKKQLKHSQDFFNKIKKEFNENKNAIPNIRQSARMVFLQKHSFNGIYRENLKGEYNTPFNWSASNTTFVVKEKINETRTLFDKFDISFSSSPYQNIHYSENTLYYLDPPYYNDNETENKYNMECFGLKQQIDLIKRIKNKNFIYSNHYNENILSLLKENNQFSHDVIERKNIMSPNSETRKIPKKEILGMNVSNKY